MYRKSQRRIMIPKLILGKNISSKKTVYTYRDLMKCEFQQLWEESLKYVEHLTQMQKKIAELLPPKRSLLPDEFVKPQVKEAQMNLLDYLRLRSIYAFADKSFKVLDQLCRDLVDAKNAQDQEGIESNSLKIETLCKTQLDDFISDEITGFQRLCNKMHELRKKSIIYDWTVIKNWTFGDIVGTINSHGLSHEELWQNAINDSFPDGVSIGALLDSDEMIRIY